MHREVPGSLTERRRFRISLDFGLGCGIAFYFWRLSIFFYRPWWWDTPLVFVIAVMGAGIPATGAAVLVLEGTAHSVRWMRANITDLTRMKRLVLALASAAAAGILAAAAGTVLALAVAAVLPAAFVAACGLWACLLAFGMVRNTGHRWLKLLPEVIGVATTAASLLLLAEHNLLTAEPTAGLLFPLAIWGTIRLWRAMRGSGRLAFRAGADITLSLLLGAELVLFLVWLANLLGMPGDEVAGLRVVLGRAGAVVDIPWWVWTGLYVLLAGVSLAFVLRPARLATVTRWFARLRVVPAANAIRKVLSCVHLGLLVTVLIGLTAPAALATTFQRQLAVAYTVALQRRFEAKGELAAYTEIRRRFTTATAPRILVQVVTKDHGISGPPGDDDATGTETDLAQRLGALQAAALGLNDTQQQLLFAAEAAARHAGFDAPVHAEADLAGRLGEVDAQEQDDDQADTSAQQAGDLAAAAVASTISIPHIGHNEVFQIVQEYLNGLVGESAVKDAFAAWAQRLPDSRIPPDAGRLAAPDPGKLEHAAYTELAREFTADGIAAELADDQAVADAMNEPPIDAAVDLANQARYLQEDSGPCAGCTAPGNPGDQQDEPVEPPPDDGE